MEIITLIWNSIRINNFIHILKMNEIQSWMWHRYLYWYADKQPNHIIWRQNKSLQWTIKWGKKVWLNVPLLRCYRESSTIEVIDSTIFVSHPKRQLLFILPTNTHTHSIPLNVNHTFLKNLQTVSWLHQICLTNCHIIFKDIKTFKIAIL